MYKRQIVNVSLSILSFLICFLGCYIVATFVIHLICYVFELPVLRHLDAVSYTHLVTAVLGMMNDNRAVVASGSEIYVVELPT